MNGVCISCDGSIAKDLVNKLRKVYSYLQSILKMLKTEQFRSDKVAERIRLYISEPDMTNKDLLSESKMYLDLTNSLNDLNKSCLTMFNTMLKTMDIYSKLKMMLRDMKSDWETYWSFIEEVDIYDDEEIINSENDSDSESGFDPDMINIFTLRSYYFHCKDKLSRIEINSERLELLIALIHKQFIAVNNNNSLSHFLLYRTFKDYHERMNRFLRSIKKI
ncbi:uncharacterized protein LOC115240449 [Formica exsecta]|uniref:uncharacterized protein LOC115240449 n=1 Tax=Formica exsecta TaxID=72781 RepID=UPI001142540D|nr:uncharacterized protein LOC115240449 [Formica exsecta]